MVRIRKGAPGKKWFLSPLLTLNKLDRPLGHISRRVPIFGIRWSINLAPMLATIGALSVRILIDKEAVFIPAFCHRPLQVVPRYARAMIDR